MKQTIIIFVYIGLGLFSCNNPEYENRTDLYDLVPFDSSYLLSDEEAEETEETGCITSLKFDDLAASGENEFETAYCIYGLYPDTLALKISDLNAYSTFFKFNITNFENDHSSEVFDFMLKMSDGGSFYEVSEKSSVDITWITVSDSQKIGRYSGDIKGWDLNRAQYGTVSVSGKFCF